MAVTINGVFCEEEVNGNSENFDILTGPQATKVYNCPWNSRWLVVTGLLGLNSSVSIGGVINIKLPLRYPDFQQTAVSLYAANVAVEGIGSPFQNTFSVGYTVARIIVNFRSFPWSFQGLNQNDFNNQIDPAHPYVYAEQRLSFTPEAITIPGTKVFWKSSGKALGGGKNWGFLSPVINMSISLKYIPYIPTAEILTATAAPVNTVTYLGVAPGQLQFMGCETNEQRMSDGSRVQSGDYSFRARTIAPWDYDFNGDLPGWDQVVDSASNPILKRSDISNVIPSYYDM